MESTGEREFWALIVRRLKTLYFPVAMKIQISGSTKDLLVSIGGFVITERGPTQIKVPGTNLFVKKYYRMLILGQRYDGDPLVDGCWLTT